MVLFEKGQRHQVGAPISFSHQFPSTKTGWIAGLPLLLNGWIGEDSIEQRAKDTKLVHPPLHLHRPRPCWIAVLLLLLNWNKGRDTKLVHQFPSPLHFHRPRPCWIAVLLLLLAPISFTPPSPSTKTLLDCCVATPSRLEQGPRHQVGAPLSFPPSSTSTTKTPLDCCILIGGSVEGPRHQVGSPPYFPLPSLSTKTLLDCCICY